MSEVLVVNASPIIVLAKAGHLDLLQPMSGQLLLPEAVAKEILRGPESDPARRALEAGWGERVVPAAIPNQLLEWGLGAGETAVLAVALERASSTAVLDDAAGRACAKAFRVPLIGTLGVVLRAKKRGIISAAAKIITALRSAGLHLDDRTIRLALGNLGEEWPDPDDE